MSASTLKGGTTQCLVNIKAACGSALIAQCMVESAQAIYLSTKHFMLERLRDICTFISLQALFDEKDYRFIGLLHL